MLQNKIWSRNSSISLNLSISSCQLFILTFYRTLGILFPTSSLPTNRIEDTLLKKGTQSIFCFIDISRFCWMTIKVFYLRTVIFLPMNSSTLFTGASNAGLSSIVKNRASKNHCRNPPPRAHTRKTEWN